MSLNPGKVWNVGADQPHDSALSRGAGLNDNGDWAEGIAPISAALGEGH